jgi:hypothetical protein
MIGITSGEVGVRRNLRRQQRASRQAAEVARSKKSAEKREAWLESLRNSLASESEFLAENAAQDYVNGGNGTARMEMPGIRAHDLNGSSSAPQDYVMILTEQIKARLAPRSRFRVFLSAGGDDMSDVFAILRIRKLGRIK